MKHTGYDIFACIDSFAPFGLQEDWDNSGLQTGDLRKAVTKTMVCLDITPEALRQAEKNNVDMIVSHHPLFMRTLKTIDLREPILAGLLKNEIAVVSVHTPLDMVPGGVSHALARTLGLAPAKNLVSIRDPRYCKLVFFCPPGKEDAILRELYSVGAGEFLRYKECAFQATGLGRFTKKTGARPVISKKGKTFKESKVELLVRKDKLYETICTIKNVHPYDEVAFDVFEEMINPVDIGYGCICETKKAEKLSRFIQGLKENLGITHVKCIGDLNSPVKKVALCGGSGGSFIKDAISAGADVFVTGDIKYHEALEARGNICLIDVGHRASEQPIVPVLKDLLKKKLSSLAVSEFIENTEYFSYI